MSCSLLDVWGLAAHGNLTEEPTGMRLVATPCVGAGEFEKLPGQRACLGHTADKEQGLAQLGEHQCLEDHVASGGHALQRLLQEREGLRSTSGKGIRHP